MASLFGALGVEITLITHGPTLAKAAGADIARRFTALTRGSSGRCTPTRR